MVIDVPPLDTQYIQTGKGAPAGSMEALTTQGGLPVLPLLPDRRGVEIFPRPLSRQQTLLGG